MGVLDGRLGSGCRIGGLGIGSWYRGLGIGVLVSGLFGCLYPGRLGPWPAAVPTTRPGLPRSAGPVTARGHSEPVTRTGHPELPVTRRYNCRTKEICRPVGRQRLTLHCGHAVCQRPSRYGVRHCGDGRGRSVRRRPGRTLAGFWQTAGRVPARSCTTLREGAASAPNPDAGRGVWDRTLGRQRYPDPNAWANRTEICG